MKKRIFVTGTGTGIGKTVISAILAEAFKADYWKPVQCGNMDNPDSKIIGQMISNPVSAIHPESYCFKNPLSPHAAAALEGVEIDVNKIQVPQTANNLIIEGAGGLMVPLNTRDLMVDLIGHLKAEVILVSENYLGSINHTLLSVEALQRRNLKLLGIIFNGKPAPSSEDFIIQYTGVKKLGNILEEKIFDKKTVLKYAEKFSHLIHE